VPTIPWDQVREVVDAVLYLPPDQRSPYLDRACPQPTVRRYVESLVFSYEEAGGFLSEPALASHAEEIAEGTADSWKGRRVGPYQITEEIGEGGMGSVYRAIRVDDQYQKLVAVKVVRSGFDNRFALNRFKAERQILANLEHPNIARLLEGGSTEDGQPYFVMEYIQGQPLDQYCDDHKLTITERLRLFRTICSAVQNAHQNLIIHRDIKPNNILVTADGVPKLLDFGIAKILSPDAEAKATQTLTMMRLMTPEYASPEQLLDEPITTASDIYSLGVVLYEVLTGERPYRFATRKPEEIARIVSDQAPEKPSAAVMRREERSDIAGGAVPRTPEDKSRTREASPEKLRRRLTGDLDNIVLMALRKEPRRRYASVEQLSEDLRRHLEGLPVMARTDTVRYRGGKFIRRHMVGVTATLLVVVSLATGLAFALRGAHIARAQRARAEQRFNDVRALANSLMFNIYDSIKDLPGSTQARQLVVSNALKYLDSLSQEAHGDRSLQRELAEAYERVGSVQGQPYTANLGDTSGALQSYLKAQSIRKALLVGGTPTDQIKYAANLRIVSVLQLQSSNAAAAIPPAREAVSTTEGLLKHDPQGAQTMTELAADYESLGNVLDETRASSTDAETDAAANYQKALAIDEKLVANSKDTQPLRNLAVDEYHIGRHLRDAGYRREALQTFNKALAVFEQLANTPNKSQAQWDLATIIINLGDTFQMDGDAAHAMANYQKGLDIVTELSLADPKNSDARLAISEANLNIGISLAKLNNATSAHALFERAIRSLEKATARQEVKWDLAVAYVWSATVTPDPKAALKDYQEALAIEQTMGKTDPANPDWHQNEAAVWVQLGNFQRKKGPFDEAAESYAKAAAVAEPIVASQPEGQEALYALADAYFGLGEIAAQRAQRASQPSDQLANWKAAKSWYQRSAGAWKRVRHPAAVTPGGFDPGGPQDAARGLARCNDALAAITVH
jgi:eukaryotic-like serine/threonine-protein kinase